MRCGLKCEVGLGKDHRHFRSRMDAIVQNTYETVKQYEILEKLVTYIEQTHSKTGLLPVEQPLLCFKAVK